MLSRGLKKYLINPCWGLIPFLLYILLYYFTNNIVNSLVASLLVTIIAEIVVRFYIKSTRVVITFLISFCALTLTLMMWMLFNHKITVENAYLIMPEIFMVCIFIIIRLSRSFLNIRFFRQDSVLQKAFINEFFEVASIIQYSLTLHIFIVLLYKFMKDSNILTNASDPILYCWLPAAGIIGLFFYENFKIKQMVGKLRKEEWLPIVNERGEVTGKIAKSVSLQMDNKFLHPVVRVALVCNGRVYLQKRPQDDILDPGKLDHPFEKYMLFNHEINIAVRNSIVRVLGAELPFKFLIKYTYENEKTKRLVFLFISRIHSEDEIAGMNLKDGKFWSIKQIDDDFGDDSMFSECFQLEYEYLKNTVLSVDEKLSKEDSLANNA